MIQYEKNLVSYTKFRNRMNYITTADKKRSLACDTTEREKINFVDENGNVVEAGIIEKSDKDITLYNYQFSKNSDDEITDCHVTKSHFKNDKSFLFIMTFLFPIIKPPDYLLFNSFYFYFTIFT